MSDTTDNDSPQQGGEDFDEPSDEIIALYCKHIPEYLSDLQTAVRENDEESVSFQCHKMLSAVKSMGFDNIARMLVTIQNEKPEGERLIELCDQVEKLIQHTLLLLRK